MSKSKHAVTAAQLNENPAFKLAVEKALEKERLQRGGQQATGPTFTRWYEARYTISGSKRQHKIRTTDLEAFKEAVVEFQREFPNLTLYFFENDLPVIKIGG